MDRALFLSMNGAKQDLLALRLHANNLANASTTGFKSDLEQARSMQVYGEGLPTRIFTMTERPSSDFKSGSVVTTGRDLDLTIKDNGWFSVHDAKGQEAYTRSGDMHIDQTGLLYTGTGHPVLGEAGLPIIVPLPISKIEIGSDGSVSVLPQGAPPNAMENIDRIKLVNPENTKLFKDQDGLFKTKNPLETLTADAAVTIESGALEGSNVSAVSEMTDLINLQRHFELQVKMMKKLEQMDESSSSLLKLS